MNHADSWQSNFEALKAHVTETGHFPNKHTRLNNWCRYQRKRIKAGVMPEEQRVLFEALAKSRSDEHTGGRRKKNVGEVSRQQAYSCNTIEKGGKKIQTSIQNEKPLKSADDLLPELRAVR